MRPDRSVCAEAETMAKLIYFIAVGTAIALGAPAVLAQDSKGISPAKIIIKTLLGSQAQKECFSLNSRQRLYYRFHADGPLDFKLSHQEDQEVIDIRRIKTDADTGSFTPGKTADHCLVWSNTGKNSVILEYEYQRGPL
jgi:hypothetical protein